MLKNDFFTTKFKYWVLRDVSMFVNIYASSTANIDCIKLVHTLK